MGVPGRDVHGCEQLAANSAQKLLGIEQNLDIFFRQSLGYNVLLSLNREHFTIDGLLDGEGLLRTEYSSGKVTDYISIPDGCVIISIFGDRAKSYGNSSDITKFPFAVFFDKHNKMLRAYYNYNAAGENGWGMYIPYGAVKVKFSYVPNQQNDNISIQFCDNLFTTKALLNEIDAINSRIDKVSYIQAYYPAGRNLFFCDGELQNDTTYDSAGNVAKQNGMNLYPSLIAIRPKSKLVTNLSQYGQVWTYDQKGNKKRFIYNQFYRNNPLLTNDDEYFYSIATNATSTPNQSVIISYDTLPSDYEKFYEGKNVNYAVTALSAEEANNANIADESSRPHIEIDFSLDNSYYAGGENYKGRLLNNSSFKTTELTPCSKYEFNCQNLYQGLNLNCRTVTFYDWNKEWVSDIEIADGDYLLHSFKLIHSDDADNSTSFKIPDDACYVVFNTNKDTLNSNGSNAEVTVTNSEKFMDMYNSLEQRITRNADGIEAIQNEADNDYVRLLSNDFADSTNWDETGSWSYNNGAKATSEGAKLTSKSCYLSDNRYIRLELGLTTSSVLKFQFTEKGNIGMGGSEFVVDMANGKLYITKLTVNSYGFTNLPALGELVSTNIGNTMKRNGVYILTISRKFFKISCELVDSLSGEGAICEYDGMDESNRNETATFRAAGLMDTYMTIAPTTDITLNRIEVFSMYRPDINVIGDSITEGYQVNANGGQTLGMLIKQHNPDKKVCITAKAGFTTSDIKKLIKSEFTYTKPKKVSILIGINNGLSAGDDIWSQEIINNTIDDYKEIIQFFNGIGTEVYLHRLTCICGINDYKRRYPIDQAMVAAGFGVEGARFDIATAIDYNPASTSESDPRGNAELYADSNVHPNGAGQLKMYQRIKIDCPSLIR